MMKLLLQGFLVSIPITLAVMAVLFFAPDDMPDRTRTMVCLAIMGVGAVVGGVWLGLKAGRQASAPRVSRRLPLRGGDGEVRGDA
jgi:hypothetical protein